MFCSKCGANLPDGSKFCPKCGTKIISSDTDTDKATNTNDRSSTYNDSTANLSSADNGTFDAEKIKELATVDKILGIVATVVNSNTYSGMLTLGFGFYVWIIANILEIVSLCMDARKPDMSYFA